MSNPIQYTSRTFDSVMDDIDSDDELVDKPSWWKRIWAGVMDVASMMLNAIANNIMLRTSFTRQAVHDLLQLIDYELSAQSTSEGDILFYISSDASFPFTVDSDDLVALSKSSASVSSLQFEARSDETVSLVEETVDYDAVDIDEDTITVSRAFTTGEKVILSGDDLPTGLSADTEYYVVAVDDTTIQLSKTLKKAYSGTVIDITAQGTSDITIDLYSFFKTVYQQETQDDATIGTSDGSTEFQEFDLPDVDVLEDTIEITINEETWDRVDSLADYDDSDNVFLLLYNTDNSSFVRFGNGTFGAIPGAFDIVASYATGGNSDSNITSVNRITTYAGSDDNISGVSNPGSLTGGEDPEDIESAKIVGPINLKSRNRFITAEDGEGLAEDYGGLSQVIVNENAYGVLSCQVVGIATGGGNPTSAYKTELQEYLIAKTILQSIDVRVEDATITAIDVTSEVTVDDDYEWDDVEPFYRLAWELMLTETGKEIYSEYSDSGIDDAVDMINEYLDESFSEDDYDKIETMLDGFEDKYRVIGESVYETAVVGFIQTYVEGVLHFTVSSPTFPIELDDDEITTVGTLTLSEAS